jgi:hypothetical protein
MDDVFESWSSTLYPYYDGKVARWVVAFDDDGQRWAESTPESDFYAPVPDDYATEAGAAAAIAVLKAWDAPVAEDKGVLEFEALRATSEWAALVPHFAGATIGNWEEQLFLDAADYEMTGGLPGAYEHYRVMVDAGVKVTE